MECKGCLSLINSIVNPSWVSDIVYLGLIWREMKSLEPSERAAFLMPLRRRHEPEGDS